MPENSCAETWTLPDGISLKMRHIRIADAGIEQAFVRSLSAHSRYLRFHHAVNDLTARELHDFTDVDPDKSTALIVVCNRGHGEEEIAVARYSINDDHNTGEFAIVVSDAWQRHGIGRRLMNALITHAEAQGVKDLYGRVLQSNSGMRNFCVGLGFVESRSADDPFVVVVTKTLVPTPPAVGAGTSVQTKASVAPRQTIDAQPDAPAQAIR